MKYTRWYDKDSRIKLIMDTLSHMEDQVKASVAMDLIQMVMNSRSPDTDEVIDEINEKYIPDRRRWYDQNETLHSAVEVLKHVSEEEKKEFLKEILYSILYFNDESELKKKYEEMTEKEDPWE